MWHEVVNFKSVCLQEIRLFENGVVFTFPSVVSQFLAVQDSSIGDLVTDSLTD